MRWRIIVFLTLLVSFAACKKNDSNNTLNETDRNFIAKAAYSNISEIKAGQLATDSAITDSVKLFGKMMIQEHLQAEIDLDSVRIHWNVSLPTTSDPDHQAELTRLQALSGLQFDTSYINSQITDHQNTIALFEDEINNGTSANVRSYASKYLPKIQMHLQLAETIKSRF